MMEMCPVATMAEILGRPWVLQIIHHLREPRHFRELQERLGGISPTLLTQRLRFLQEQGLVRKVDIGHRFSPYTLTEAGEELLPILDALAAWSRKWVLPRRRATLTTETAAS